jgi:transglutaminase-like putative cysteine protease
LRIETNFVVETLRANPFDFLLLVDSSSLPVTFTAAERRLAAYYATPAEHSAAVGDFARQIARESGSATMSFLTTLAATIHGNWQIVSRATGEPWAAEHTFRERQGACRDLAVLFNEACRSQGLPARFVSGYCDAAAPPADAEEDPKKGDSLLFDHEQRRAKNELHAWSEVYLPGGGWRGFDPSIGLAVGHQHVALAAGRLPRDAAPVEGAFRGDGVVSQLNTFVEVLSCDPLGSNRTLTQQQRIRS